MKRRPRLPQRLMQEVARDSGASKEHHRSGRTLLRSIKSRLLRKEARRELRVQNKRKILNRRRLQKRQLTQSHQNRPIQKTAKDPKKTQNEDLIRRPLISQSRKAQTSSSESLELESVDDGESTEEQGTQKTSFMKYTPPYLRQDAASGRDQNLESIQRRIRGLLNRISEQNIRGIVNEFASLYNGFGRINVSFIFGTEVIKAVSEGPRATDQFIGILSATVASFSVLSNAHEIPSTFLSHLALAIKTQYHQDDSLGAVNLINLLSHVYLCGLVTSRVVYGVLEECTMKMSDLDVALMHKILQICGLRLRSDDPDLMKNFIINLHNKVADLTQTKSLSQRAEVMLDLVIDIKNNQLSKTGRRETLKSLSPVLGRYLQELQVHKMALDHLTWTKLCDPNKSGRWWLPDSKEHVSQANFIPKELSNDLHESGMELLSLAAQQRMNTDLRRGIFCIIMGSQDPIDACEKLIRLSLKGEQDREVIRVLIDCCLQEKRWNPYYSILATKISKAKSSHSTTLRFCIKDKLKTLEALEIRQMDHLAKFLTQLIAMEVLSLGIVKSFDLSSELTKRSLFFWRIFYIHLLLSYSSLQDFIEATSKLITASESFQLFGKKLLVFFQFHFEPWIMKLNTKTAKWITRSEYRTLLERYRALNTLLKSIV